jgi:hypothetical protein
MSKRIREKKKRKGSRFDERYSPERATLGLPPSEALN